MKLDSILGRRSWLNSTNFQAISYL